MKDTPISQLSAELSEGEAVLITSDASRQYFTGFKSSAGTVLVTPNDAVLFIDSRYFEKASGTVTSCKVMLLVDIASQLKERLEVQKTEIIYTETSCISLEEYNLYSRILPSVKVSTDNKADLIIKKLRSKKSQEELEFIKYSQSLTDKTFEYILDYISVGKTEKQTALEMEFFMRRLGSEGVAFDFIVVSGKNSSLPHGVPTEKSFEKGDFITMDFGAVYSGYCSDMTRTVALGEITDEQKQVYNTVLEAQSKALEIMRAGITGLEADKAARDVIENRGYGEFFGHSLGHSVGLEIHEYPNCSPKSKTVLESGVIMTVEPGIYIPEKFGVRIEDMVLIRENGCENLTHSPKNLIIL